jgi:hypothetical protein
VGDGCASGNLHGVEEEIDWHWERTAGKGQTEHHVSSRQHRRRNHLHTKPGVPMILFSTMHLVLRTKTHPTCMQTVPSWLTARASCRKDMWLWREPRFFWRTELQSSGTVRFEIPSLFFSSASGGSLFRCVLGVLPLITRNFHVKPMPLLGQDRTFKNDVALAPTLENS